MPTRCAVRASVRAGQCTGADPVGGRRVHHRYDRRRRGAGNVEYGAEGRGSDTVTDAEVAATIANSGVLMQPYLVDSLKGPDLSNIATTAPQEQRRAVSPQVAAKLTDLMIGAEQLTQQKGAIPGVQIASRPVPPSTAPTRGTHHHMLGTSRSPRPESEGRDRGADRERRRPLSATGGSLAAPIGRATIAAALQGAS